MGNPNLKLGDGKETGETIEVEIVTVEDSLVERIQARQEDPSGHPGPLEEGPLTYKGAGRDAEERGRGKTLPLFNLEMMV